MRNEVVEGSDAQGERCDQNRLTKNHLVERRPETGSLRKSQEMYEITRNLDSPKIETFHSPLS
jgi:hypothetical protein